MCFILCLAPEKCRAPLDLIFLLDASGSVGADNYVKEKEFIKIMTSRFDLETTSQAAVIVFSSDASNKIQLGSKKTALSFATAVDNLRYDARYTRIDLALRMAYDEYFSSASSDETQKLVILLTDGIQTNYNGMTPAYIPTNDTIQLLRAKAARIFAVTIGSNIDMTAMRAVTEEDDDIFQTTQFNDLVAKADSISKTSCIDARKLTFMCIVQISYILLEWYLTREIVTKRSDSITQQFHYFLLFSFYYWAEIVRCCFTG